MAQLVLTLAGGVLGGGIAGGLGQSLGALFGAYVGGILDKELFGPQQDRRTVEGARLTELNLSGSAYGQTMPVVWGRMRVPANIIWVRGIREVVRTETETVGGGGKGGGGGGGTQTVTRTSYHYHADVALGICEAPVTSIYRVWLDKTPLDPEHVDEIRTYYGDETQSPDPLIQAVEGADRTPAFRGLAYVVLENLYLTPYGNRFPNFEIEVYRGSRADVADARHLVRNVCLIPASGEWAYEPSRFVLLDPARQPRPNFSVSRMGIEIAWRYAPVPQGPSGDLSGEIVFTNTGNGLRPLAPVHLKAVRDPSSGDVQLSWTRRTRVGGDSWLNEVPLGEETEEYDVLILDGASVVRTIRVASQGALYTAAQQTADFGAPPASLAWRVAQISRAYGRGVQTEALSTL